MESVDDSLGWLGVVAGGQEPDEQVSLFVGLDTTRRGLGAVDHRTAYTAKAWLCGKAWATAEKFKLFTGSSAEAAGSATSD